ncbi:MAG: RnfH family protein [Burkholderiales bacterium]|nr:RnfH family protein [Burkholderiales bacterium]
MANADTIQVVVHWSPQAREVCQWRLSLPSGSTLDDALRACGLHEKLARDAGAALQFGIWAKARPLDTVLRDQDRVEVWRGLKVDPKEARRQRYRRSKERQP